MIAWLQKKYALSQQGAKDLVKGCFACLLQNLSFMVPVGLLFLFVRDLMAGGVTGGGGGAFYLAGCLVCLVLIFLTTWFQYNATYFATYVESGVRRVTLAERLRQIPLSFFGKKDLSDLTSTIMADCTFLEQSFSHFIPELVGSICSTVLVAVGLLFVDWRMALAALWVLPVSFAIVGGSAKVQERMNQKAMDAKMAAADGIQECIETLRDLKASNAERRYLAGLTEKIRAVERRSTINEFSLAAFVVSASLILKLGIATVALVGSVLLVQGSLDVLTFFLFLLVASRLYDPLQAALQNLAAVISTRTNIARMKEILDHPIQQGTTTLTNRGCDIVFDHVGFAYHTGEQVLRDVSFTAKQGEVTALVGPSVRLREVHYYPVGRPVLGFGPGEDHRGGDGDCPSGPGDPPVPVCHRLSGRDPLRQHHFGKHPHRPEGCHRRRGPGGSPTGQLRRVCREAPRGLAHQDWGERQPALRRGAAAGVHCQGLFEERPHPPFG